MTLKKFTFNVIDKNNFSRTGLIETKNGEETIIEDWSSKTHGGSRSKMLEFLIKYNCPEEHRRMVALDMKF